MTKDEAKKQGLKQFDGKPCGKCGERKRRVCDGRCVKCMSEGAKAWQIANPERHKATRAAYEIANADRLRAERATYHAANRDKIAVTKAAYVVANREKIKVRKAKHRAANIDRERVYRTAYYARVREDVLAERAAWRRDNPEQARAVNAAWAKAHPEKVRAASAAWRKANPEKARAAAAAWRKANPEKTRAYAAERRAALARPAWVKTPALKQEIDRIYAECPQGYDVDHIVPLLGESVLMTVPGETFEFFIEQPVVCGLHVPANLQYLPAAENTRKFNHFQPTHVVKEAAVV